MRSRALNVKMRAKLSICSLGGEFVRKTKFLSCVLLLIFVVLFSSCGESSSEFLNIPSGMTAMGVTLNGIDIVPDHIPIPLMVDATMIYDPSQYQCRMVGEAYADKQIGRVLVRLVRLICVTGQIFDYPSIPVADVPIKGYLVDGLDQKVGLKTDGKSGAIWKVNSARTVVIYVTDGVSFELKKGIDGSTDAEVGDLEKKGGSEQDQDEEFSEGNNIFNDSDQYRDSARVENEPAVNANSKTGKKPAVDEAEAKKQFEDMLKEFQQVQKQQK